MKNKKKILDTSKENKSNILSVVDLVNPLNDTKESISMSFKLFISAITLVAGLAWNDAIRGLIDNAIQPAVTNLLNQTFGDLALIVTPFIYAVIITLAVVYVINRAKKMESKFNKYSDSTKDNKDEA